MGKLFVAGTGTKDAQTAQASIELLVVFAVTTAIILMVIAALLTQTEMIRTKTKEIELANKAEAAARAIETYRNCMAGGVATDFDLSSENVSYSVEHGKFIVRIWTADGERVVQVDGIFVRNFTRTGAWGTGGVGG